MGGGAVLQRVRPGRAVLRRAGPQGAPPGAGRQAPAVGALLGGRQRRPGADRAWWEREPDANVGIACVDGLVVLDVDGAEGERTLAALIEQNGPVPGAPTRCRPVAADTSTSATTARRRAGAGVTWNSRRTATWSLPRAGTPAARYYYGAVSRPVPAPPVAGALPKASRGAGRRARRATPEQNGDGPGRLALEGELDKFRTHSPSPARTATPPVRRCRALGAHMRPEAWMSAGAPALRRRRRGQLGLAVTPGWPPDRQRPRQGERRALRAHRATNSNGAGYVREETFWVPGEEGCLW